MCVYWIRNSALKTKESTCIFSCWDGTVRSSNRNQSCQSLLTGDSPKIAVTLPVTKLRYILGVRQRRGEGVVQRNGRPKGILESPFLLFPLKVFRCFQGKPYWGRVPARRLLRSFFRPDKVFPRICLPKFLANLGWTFWCEILLKPFILWREKAQFVHEILGKASDDSLLLEDFFGPRPLARSEIVRKE